MYSKFCVCFFASAANNISKHIKLAAALAKHISTLNRYFTKCTLYLHILDSKNFVNYYNVRNFSRKGIFNKAEENNYVQRNLAV